LTKEERDRTKTREKINHTNLFVEKLPYIFKEEDVLNLFQKYGTVLEVKIKKPNSNVQLSSINSLPCSAYVNFIDMDSAKAAIQGLNGKAIIAGGNSLRIDYYQRANRFYGGMLGLDRNELINNTHFRVLFLKGMRRNVSFASKP
jgi:RNA recognition motif-containing protein